MVLKFVKASAHGWAEVHYVGDDIALCRVPPQLNEAIEREVTLHKEREALMNEIEQLQQEKTDIFWEEFEKLRLADEAKEKQKKQHEQAIKTAKTNSRTKSSKRRPKYGRSLKTGEMRRYKH